ncbi:MAG TPA: lytic murein transglycosylase [Desulfatiglandales bacterium]|nr:lytic murein transglycosylase [Desulfatiglandales bacterium]
MKYIIICILFISLLTAQLLFLNPAYAKDINPVFENLLTRLQMDGIEEKYLHTLFTHPELELMYEVVALSLTRKEANLNYAQFLTQDSVNKAVSYLKIHDTTLKKAENHFGVSAPVVVAILSVETAFGKYTGYFNTVNILVTQSLSLEAEIYQQIVNQIPLQEKSTLTPNQIKTKLKKKSARAYGELKALLIYAKEHNIDPFIIKGSTEGAIGLPQFLPSNIKKYGSDGNGDNKINLFEHDDAIASIASYLKAHKWREGNSYKKKQKIILKYNNSMYYANTVLTLAERLSHYWHKKADS